jgi:hypothetical protein
MANTAGIDNHVHLVGSIGLDSVEEVLRTSGKLLGRRLKRVPDGEVGGRRLWVSWQYPLLRSSPYLMPDPGGAIRKTSKFPLLCLAPGVDADDSWCRRTRFSALSLALEWNVDTKARTKSLTQSSMHAGYSIRSCLPAQMEFAIGKSDVRPRLGRR